VVVFKQAEGNEFFTVGVGVNFLIGVWVVLFQKLQTVVCV